MPMVRATARGYYGLLLRNPGDIFFYDDKAWKDKPPSWAEKVTAKEVKGDLGAAQPISLPVLTPTTLVIPDNWPQLGLEDRKTIAAAIAAPNPPPANEADANNSIEAYIRENPTRVVHVGNAAQPGVFGEAPAPEVVSQYAPSAKESKVEKVEPTSQAAEIAAETGEKTGDWMPPGSDDAPAKGSVGKK